MLNSRVLNIFYFFLCFTLNLICFFVYFILYMRNFYYILSCVVIKNRINSAFRRIFSFLFIFPLFLYFLSCFLKTLFSGGHTGPPLRRQCENAVVVAEKYIMQNAECRINFQFNCNDGLPSSSRQSRDTSPSSEQAVKRSFGFLQNQNNRCSSLSVKKW